MSRFTNAMVLLGIGVLTTIFSCKKDDPIIHVDPGINFASGTGLINADISVPIYTPIKIKLTAVKGSTPLKYIKVEVDGIQLAPSDFDINGVDAPANPALLFNQDKEGVTNTYEFDPSTEPDTILYEFTIADDNDSLVVNSISVIFTAIPATERAKGLIVYNFTGPRQAGVDLFNSKIVSGNDPNATIRDYGVVDPMSNGTWVKKFTPRNGSIIKDPPAGLSFSEISYVEDIIYLFDNGSNDVGTTDTKVLAKGDFFIVKNGTAYFAISIDNLTFTANDNLDNYEIAIKR